MEELLVNYYRNISTKTRSTQNLLETLQQELEFGRLDHATQLLKEPPFLNFEDHNFFAKTILILKEFRKDELCSELLRYQILNIENEGNLQKGTEKYENFIADCREYFLEILVRIKEVDFIKNELSIIKNEEIRNSLREELYERMAKVSLEKDEIKRKEENKNVVKGQPNAKSKPFNKKFVFLVILACFVLFMVKFKKSPKILQLWNNFNKIFKLIMGFN